MLSAFRQSRRLAGENQDRHHWREGRCGIEIPALPAELGTFGDSATTAVQTVTEFAPGVIDGATETVGTAVDSATQALPDVTGPTGANPPK